MYIWTDRVKKTKSIINFNVTPSWHAWFNQDHNSESYINVRRVSKLIRTKTELEVNLSAFFPIMKKTEK